MKKLLVLLLAVLMLAALTACGDKSPAEPSEENSTVACTHENTSFKEIKAPTCTEKGLTHKVCDDCEAVLEENESNAVGHVWSPREDENGNRYMACGICGEKFDDAAVVPGA